MLIKNLEKHTIHYISNSNNNINIKQNIFKDILFEQKEWDNKNFREKYIKQCFEYNNMNSEIECYNFIKGKLENKIYLNENLKNEIKSSKLSLNLKNRSSHNIK